jgi:hypothetical protein
MLMLLLLVVNELLRLNLVKKQLWIILEFYIHDSEIV